jgi:allophanate hydrolase subunit 2
MQLRDGQRLRIGTAKTGLYAYLAVAGGIAVDPVLGSRATDTLSGLGSPALTAGTTLPIGEAVARQPSESATPTIVDNTEPLAVAPGPHLPAMRPGVLTAFLDSSWTVTPAADRVALRLAGPVVEPGLAGIDSEGLVPGAIQLLPNGQPILFLANHPATGGYPVVAVVARGDLGRAAQSRPGATLSFVLRRH